MFTDSKKFNEYCTGKGHDVRQVAEHIIAEGKGFKNKVLYGGFATINKWLICSRVIYLKIPRTFIRYRNRFRKKQPANKEIWKLRLQRKIGKHKVAIM